MRRFAVRSGAPSDRRRPPVVGHIVAGRNRRDEHLRRTALSTGDVVDHAEARTDRGFDCRARLALSRCLSPNRLRCGCRATSGSAATTQPGVHAGAARIVRLSHQYESDAGVVRAEPIVNRGRAARLSTASPATRSDRPQRQCADRSPRQPITHPRYVRQPALPPAAAGGDEVEPRRC